MLVLVSLVHAAGFVPVFLRVTGRADPAGFGSVLLFVMAAVPSLAINLLVWIHGSWLVVLAGNIAGAAAIFLYMNSLSADAVAEAPWGALLFAALGIPLSACLWGWRRWLRRRAF